MKDQDLKELFNQLRGDLDLYETPEGHQRRFSHRLNRANGVKAIKRWWLKPLSIAASIVVIVGLAYALGARSAQPEGLAGISPEMAETQSYFLLTINQEIARLDSYRSPQTELLIEDALQQLDRLDGEYQKLKTELIKSGNDKRVISAMIQNFQSRIDLLEQVLGMAEELKNLKFNENEITI
jgi:hypothetical protein